MASGGRSFVCGRVLDEHGRPLAGASITLSSQGKWAPGQEPPTIVRQGVEYQAFEAQSDDEGAFALEVPRPAASWVTLRVKRDAHHGRATRWFGPSGGRDQPRLVPGTNDLGDLRLATTGAVRGEVLDESGAPIEGAAVDLRSDDPFGAQPARSGRDGKYLLHGLPEGELAASAWAPGFLEQRVSGVVARRGLTLAGPTFRLERAPAVSGFVVDEAGAPIEGVRVEVLPQGSGRSASARTGAEGRFTLFLPRSTSYTLAVRDERFLPWGGSAAESTVQPGTRDVRIVLTPSPILEFHVRGARDHASVERFGLLLLDAGWPASIDDLELADHAGGSVTLPISQARRVAVIAEGYAGTCERVRPDVGTPARQTLRLQPESVIHGRLLVAGRPAAYARASLSREVLGHEPDEIMGEVPVYDVPPHPGTVQTSTGGADGSFLVAGLPEGTYRLRFAAQGHRAERRGLRVEAGKWLDIGLVELERGATIHGRVVGCGGAGPVGTRVTLDFPRGEWLTVACWDGSFELTGLDPGRHTLRARGAGRSGLVSGEVSVEARAGRTAHVEIDLGSDPRRGVERHLARVSGLLIGCASAGLLALLARSRTRAALAR